MRKYLKIRYLILLIIAIQFYRPSKNIQNKKSKTNIFEIEHASVDVQDLIETSCYDCHSNNTHYPWYAEIAPVSWWLDHHINEGKGELNFDLWGTYSEKRKRHKLKEMKEMLEEHEMPLETYLWLHKDAKLTEDQINTIIDWARALNPSIDTKEPKK